MKTDHLAAVAVINPPAAEESIARVEAQLGISLPGAYRELLRAANGMMFYNGLFVYAVDDIVERNETFEVKTYASGHIAIGDDSAGCAVMLSLNSERVLIVGMGSMDPDTMETLSDCLHSWVAAGCPLALG